MNHIEYLRSKEIVAKFEKENEDHRDILNIDKTRHYTGNITDGKIKIRLSEPWYYRRKDSLTSAIQECYWSDLRIVFDGTTSYDGTDNTYPCLICDLKDTSPETIKEATTRLRTILPSLGVVYRREEVY